MELADFTRRARKIAADLFVSAKVEERRDGSQEWSVGIDRPYVAGSLYLRTLFVVDRDPERCLEYLEKKAGAVWDRWMEWRKGKSSG